MDIISSHAQVLIKDGNGSSGVNIRSTLAGYVAVLNFWGHGPYLAREKGCSDWKILILPSDEWISALESSGFEILGKLSDLTQAALKQ
jgi:hypothetical protein